jgi:uncharacterized protein (TIGR02996 family)
MPSDTDFLQSIISNAEDDTPRLAYADWLDERGDPRGEFIRVQIELSRMSREDARASPLYTRENSLLVKHEKEWISDVRRLIRGWRFHRGFIEEVVMGVQQFLSHADIVFSSAPIRQLKLLGGQKLIDRVAQSSHLARLNTLVLYRLTDDGARKLAACPYLAELTELDLWWDCQIGDAGAIALANSLYLCKLTNLRVREDRLGDAGKRALSRRFGDHK